jgi:hypothetical protein
MDGVIDYPTGGPRSLNHPATPQGTVNEATPEPYYGLSLTARTPDPYYNMSLGTGELPYPYGTPESLVKSYLTEDQDGNRVVMNVTLPGHPLYPGYVVRYVTPSGDGSTIQTEGEGLGYLQRRESHKWLRNMLNIDTWLNANKEIADRAK